MTTPGSCEQYCIYGLKRYHTPVFLACQFFGAGFVIHLTHSLQTIMLIKLNPHYPAFARQERVKQQTALTKQQWITIDRIVMLLMFVSVITGAVIFS